MTNHLVTGPNGHKVFVDVAKLPLLYRLKDNSAYCSATGSPLTTGALYRDTNNTVWRKTDTGFDRVLSTPAKIKTAATNGTDKNKYGLKAYKDSNANAYKAPERTLVPVAMPAAIVDLAVMLRWRRPASSKTERKFIREFITPLNPDTDKAGNLYVTVGEKPDIMWSCHTDTVHIMGGKQDLIAAEVTQPDANRKDPGTYLVLDPKSKSNCLGTDDTVGVWLMLCMIRAKVPGLYVFHRDEELGCKGSGYASEHEKDRFVGMRACIALDRRGTGDIITKQRWARCCSDEFATTFAVQLGVGSQLKYEPAEGIYTDSAEYTDLIGECTNVSVGYYGEHGREERVQIEHALALRDRLVQGINWSAVTFARKPGETEYENDYSAYFGNGKYASEDWFETISRWRGFRGEKLAQDEEEGQAYGKGPGGSNRSRGHSSGRDFSGLVEMVKDNPSAIAAWLEHAGYDAVEFAMLLQEWGGTIRPYLRHELGMD
jgi:hypothetical protein